MGKYKRTVQTTRRKMLRLYAVLINSNSFLESRVNCVIISLLRYW